MINPMKSNRTAVLPANLESRNATNSNAAARSKAQNMPSHIEIGLRFQSNHLFSASEKALWNCRKKLKNNHQKLARKRFDFYSFKPSKSNIILKNSK